MHIRRLNRNDASRCSKTPVQWRFGAWPMMRPELMCTLMYTLYCSECGEPKLEPPLEQLTEHSVKTASARLPALR